MRLVRPYFRDGELFCYLASVGHWHDVGGACRATTIRPPPRLPGGLADPAGETRDRGEVQQDIIDILMRNTRLPQSALWRPQRPDQRAGPGRKRLDALLDEYGAPPCAPRLVRWATGPRR
jgi:N-methylhydantoinase B